MHEVRENVGLVLVALGGERAKAAAYGFLLADDRALLRGFFDLRLRGPPVREFGSVVSPQPSSSEATGCLENSGSS